MKRFNYLLKIIIFLASTLWLSGCIFTDDHHHKQRDRSLSKAIETGNAGRTVTHEPYYPPPPSIYYDPPPVILDDYSANKSNEINDPTEVETPSSSNTDTGEKTNKDPGEPLTFSVSIHNQISGHDYLEDTVIYSLAVEGTRDDKLAIAGRLSFANMAFTDSWAYSTNLKDPWSIDIGIEGKMYFTEKKHFLQPYVGVYLAYGAMYWSYKKDLIDHATGEIIKKDHVDYIKLGAIAGMLFKVSKSVSVTAEIRPEVIFPGTTTHHGFINDIINECKGTYAGINVNFYF